MILLFTLLAATFALFSYTEVMATGDCSSGAGTCYDFKLGYRVEAIDVGVPEGGFLVFRYRVTVPPNIKKPPTNNILMGIQAPIVVESSSPDSISNYAQSYELCKGDPTLNVGIGDCANRWFRWTTNFPTGEYQMVIAVAPPVLINRVPLYMKASDEGEWGAVVGSVAPTAEIIENTMFEDTAEDGSKLRVTLDREGNVLQALKCTAPPDNPAFCEDPNNFVDITDQFTVLGDTYFGIPELLPDFPANSTLSFDDGRPDIRLHSGPTEFMNEGTTIQFGNLGRCKVIAGKYRCY